MQKYETQKCYKDNAKNNKFKYYKDIYNSL